MDPLAVKMIKVSFLDIRCKAATTPNILVNYLVLVMFLVSWMKMAVASAKKRGTLAVRLMFLIVIFPF